MKQSNFALSFKHVKKKDVFHDYFTNCYETGLILGLQDSLPFESMTYPFLFYLVLT